MYNILQQILTILKSLSSIFLERKRENSSHKGASDRTQVIRIQRINTDQKSVKICKNPCHPCAISSCTRGLVLKSLHNQKSQIEAATAVHNLQQVPQFQVLQRWLLQLGVECCAIYYNEVPWIAHSRFAFVSASLRLRWSAFRKRVSPEPTTQKTCLTNVCYEMVLYYYRRLIDDHFGFFTG